MRMGPSVRSALRPRNCSRVVANLVVEWGEPDDLAHLGGTEVLRKDCKEH